MPERSLLDEISVLIAAIKPQQVLPPKGDREPDALSLGQADLYLQKLYTLIQLLEDELGHLSTETTALETLIENGEERRWAPELARIQDRMLGQQELLQVVEALFNMEVLRRNKELRRYPFFQINSDWTFTSPEESSLPGASPLKPQEQKFPPLPKASDGTSTLQ